MEPSPKHAFISYVKEDKERVKDLKAALEAAGIPVWLDKDALWPGMDWRLEIKAAIRSGTMAFIACFSEESQARKRSYQNEELILAVEEYRLRPPGTQWLFPLRLDDVEVPQFSLGAGKDLSDLHFTDLFGAEQLQAMSRLSVSVRGALQLDRLPVGGIDSVFISEDRIKSLLRDQNADIQLEDYSTAIAREVKDQLNDASKFPQEIPESLHDDDLEQVRYVGALMSNYERVVDPLARLLLLAGIYGRAEHTRAWQSVMEVVASTVWNEPRPAQRIVAGLRGYPLLLLLYVLGISSMLRDNYGTLRAGFLDARAHAAKGKTSAGGVTDLQRVEADLRWVFTLVRRSLDQGEVLTAESVAEVKGDGRRRGRVMFTPVSDHLFDHLWKTYFEPWFTNMQEFEVAFDDYEVLADAVVLDIQDHAAAYLGAGRYTYRHRHADNPPEMAMRLEAETKSFAPTAAGFFGRDEARATKAFDRLAQMIAVHRNTQH